MASESAEQGKPLTVLEIKAVVRERDGFRCTDCGMTNEEHLELTGRILDVHRLVPGSPYSVDGCVTLCRACHGPKPRSKPGNNPSPVLSLRPSDDLRTVLKNLADAERRTASKMVQILLEEAIKARGL